MDTIHNVTQLLVGADVALTALTDLDLLTAPSQLADGEVAIVDQANRYLDGSTAAANGLVRFVQRSGDKLIQSDVLDLTKITQYSITSSAAETQQLDYVGFNGTTGDLDEIASNIYTIRLYYQEMLIAGFMQQKIKEGFYKSNAVAASYTQATVAEALVKSLIANYSREADKDISFGMTASGANLDLGTGAGTVTFTKGSKYVVFGTAIDDATVNAILGVGDLLAVSDAKTEAMYRVVSIDVPTETAELSHAYQGETATIANATVGRVLAATAAAGDYGVKLQGVDRLFKTGYFASRVAQWKTTIDMGDAATAIITSTAAYPGVGTGDAVATLEKELQADEYIYRGDVESGVVDRTDAIPGNSNDYDIQILEYAGIILNGLGVEVQSPKTLEVAWKTGTNAVAADVAAVLELLLTAAGVTYTTQAANLT